MAYFLIVSLVLFCFPASALAQPVGGVRPAPDLIVGTAWLAKHASDPNLAILHVGTDRKVYDSGHVPGARFLSLRDIAVSRDGTPNELAPVGDLARVFEALGVGDRGRIIVYGDEQGLFAARVFFTLEYLGHGDRVALLDGGLEKWKTENRPIETAAPETVSRPFTPRVNPDVLVTLQEVRDIAWTIGKGTPGWILIDARPEAQFTGAEAGEGVTRAGHIPGAANLFWQKAIVSTEDPRLRPATELRRLMEGAGARVGSKVVTYCRTGVQASFAYFVARYLGYPVRMYDGSFLEWSRAGDTAVARQ